MQSMPWYEDVDRTMTILQVAVPFIALLALNALIVYRLHTTEQQFSRNTRTNLLVIHQSVFIVHHSQMTTPATEPNDTMSPQNALNASQHRRQLREDKRRLRSAVFTMAVLVSSHLVCNSVHVTLTGRCSHPHVSAQTCSVLETPHLKWLFKDGNGPVMCTQ